MTTVDQVRDHFEQEARHYDELIPKLIPHYHEQNALMIELIPFGRETVLKALDLGCGTGVLAHAVLTAFPRARVTAFDLAGTMLAACRAKLSPFEGRFTLRQGNFAADDLGAGYDLVVSGLAIHHLDDAGKRGLYGRINEAVAPGGIFLHRDIVLGVSPEINSNYGRLWRAFMRANGEDDAKWFGKAFEEDIPATVEDQLAWLAEAGFTDVACHWRYLNLAIFSGRRAAAG
jgi:tRNA (cmo5U34)-methyltransferase